MKISLSLLLMFCSLQVFAQSAELPADYDQVTLDGQPAYINVKTGDIVKELPNGVTRKTRKAKKFATQTVTTNPNGNTHHIAKGETLYAISRKYGTSIAELTALNPDISINNLQVDQQINVRVTGTKMPSNEVSNTSATATTYEVKKGDTLYAISRMFNLSVSDLTAMNNLSSSTLSVGQVLLVKR